MSIDCGILIRTYHKDANWLRWCLRSIRKHCRGFSQVVVVCNPASVDAITPVTVQEGFGPPQVFPEFRYDYLAQQITKMYADKFLTTDFVMHVDSDCVFTEPTTPEDFFRDGKPVLYCCPYDVCYRTAHISAVWQTPTSMWLQRQTDFEFMRRFPMVYPREVYGLVREHFEKTHGMDLGKAFSDRTDENFSEFNYIGSFLYYEAPHLMTFHDTSKNPDVPRLKMKQFGLRGRDDRSISEEEMRQIGGYLGLAPVDASSAAAS